MFYLTTHSTQFILRLYGIGHMVKNHSDRERGNPLPPHGLLFWISSKGSFICIIRQTMAFVTPVMEHWLEQEIAQWVYPMKDRSDDPSYHGATSRSISTTELNRYHTNNAILPCRWHLNQYQAVHSSSAFHSQ